MSAYDKVALLASLKQGEGLRLKVYDDATGKEIGPGSTVVGHPTIGLGTALDVDGITEAQAELLAGDDADVCDRELETHYPWYPTVEEPRRRVLIEMVYNMGLGNFGGFHAMIDALEVQNYGQAADEMLDSEWSKQIGTRAIRLSNTMRNGG